MSWVWVEHGFAVLGMLCWLAGIAVLATLACDDPPPDSPVGNLKSPYRQFAAALLFIPWPFYMVAVALMFLWEIVEDGITR